MKAGERSHGMARPRQIRASDLVPAPLNGGERVGQRDARGRWVAGNSAGLGRGSTAPIRRLLGGLDVTDAEARVVARDAARVFAEAIRTLPDDGPIVRQLCALYSRHVALSGFWSAKAGELGLASDEGSKAAERASKDGQRAERLSVTMLDVARVQAEARPKQGSALDQMRARVAAAVASKEQQ